MNVILLYFNGQKFYLVLMDANYYVVILFVCLFVCLMATLCLLDAESLIFFFF